jgi:hypothetical protein
MFWWIVGILGGGAAVVETGRVIVKHVESGKPTAKGGARGAKPIAPPGTPQPAGVVALPIAPVMSDGDALHTSARALLTALATTAPSSGSNPAVSAFQTAYDATNPPVKLKVDGKYGPKCQAALQSVIAPALAPSNFFAGSAPVKVQTPPIQAAPAIPNVDVTGAANILAAVVSLPKSSDRRVTTFQHAWNATPGVLHLAEDGKYGGSSQGALQSVLDYMGTGLQAPKNPFGPVVPAPSYPPNVLELG